LILPFALENATRGKIVAVCVLAISLDLVWGFTGILVSPMFSLPLGDTPHLLLEAQLVYC